MEVCYDADALTRSGALAAIGGASIGGPAPGPPNPPGRRPVLVDRFLEDAVEVDVDALCDATGQALVCGVMEHIEEAGIHSGDSACVLPPITLGPDQVAAVEEATARLGRALGVVGVLNVQFAFKGERLYVLEANPRASRSVPFVEKVTGLPVAKAAARLMTGSTLAGLALEAAEPAHVGVKEAVLPFARFPGADSLLGPEMRSTGEVLGLDARFGAAFAKSQEAAYGALPAKGVAFLSVRNADKRAIVLPAKRLADLGFTLVATTGTAGVLHRNGVAAAIVRKGHEGPDNVVDKIRAGEIDLVVNTPAGPGAREDGYDIRIAAVAADIPCITTLSGLTAVVQGIEARLAGDLAVRPLQSWHDGPAGSGTEPRRPPGPGP
jgi:carbamoyl-phosphate synthase large subunit